MRNFAIIRDDSNDSYIQKLISLFPENSNVVVFSETAYEIQSPNHNIQVQIIPDVCDNKPKVFNHIIKYFKENHSGFLYVFDKGVVFRKEPKTFYDEIEKMMILLKQDSWLNCSCDMMNYTYQLFNPRIVLKLDHPEVQNIYNKDICWCSNANTDLVIYNLDMIDISKRRFNEQFTIPMYYIIEFLATRRNTKRVEDLYFMNMYPTISEEEKLVMNTTPHKQEDQQKLQKDLENEDKIFKSMNINVQPDSDIDILTMLTFKTLTENR